MCLDSRERATPQQPDSPDSPDLSTRHAEKGTASLRFGWWLVLISAVALILRLAVVYEGRHKG